VLSDHLCFWTVLLSNPFPFFLLCLAPHPFESAFTFRLACSALASPFSPYDTCILFHELLSSGILNNSHVFVGDSFSIYSCSPRDFSRYKVGSECPVKNGGPTFNHPTLQQRGPSMLSCLRARQPNRSPMIPYSVYTPLRVLGSSPIATRFPVE